MCGKAERGRRCEGKDEVIENVPRPIGGEVWRGVEGEEVWRGVEGEEVSRWS